MDIKWSALIFVILYLVGQVVADFWFNLPAEQKKVINPDLKCVPGRTTIKIAEPKVDTDTVIKKTDSESDEAFINSRRTHSWSTTKDESCQMCVCSGSGKDEYCRNRPAANVNECLMLMAQKEKQWTNMPFDHVRTLSQRIRRDYLWHNDEIPYQQDARCYRGHTYYTNSPRANESTIASAEESNLNYDDPGAKKRCLYCICSVDGTDVECIHRNVWFCSYIRFLNQNDSSRDMYRVRLDQDRPTYFRELSWRLRRTMDDSIYEFISAGGDSLCCGHPDGHRRQIHNGVRHKLRSLKRKIPKENLLGGAMKEDYVDFVVNND